MVLNEIMFIMQIYLLFPYKNCHQILWLEIIHIYYLIVSVGQESGPNLAGCLWLEFTHEIAAKLLAGSEVSSENLTGEKNFKFTRVGFYSSGLLG